MAIVRLFASTQLFYRTGKHSSRQLGFSRQINFFLNVSREDANAQLLVITI